MIDLPQARFAKHPLVAIGLSLATGILIHITIQNVILAVAFGGAAAFLLVFAIWVHKRVILMATISLLCAFVCTGYVLAFVEQQSVSSHHIGRMIEQGIVALNEPVEVTGHLQGEPESAPDGLYLNLKVEEIQTHGSPRAATGTLWLLAHLSDRSVKEEYDALQLHHGARIRLLTVLDRDDDYRNPGVLPFTEYLERQGYDATGVIKSPLLIERLEDARVFLPLAWIYEWRVRIEREFDQRFSPETAGVLEAFLLGNQYKISRPAADRFREGGTFHVLVISGMQISFIAGLLFLLMRRLTRNRVIQFFSILTILLAYSLAVGAQAPVVRAALVFSFGIFAPLVWRRANSLNLIAGAALVLLVWRPGDLLNPSFQLTFLSVLAIVTLPVPIMIRMQQVGAWRPTHETPYPPECLRWFRSLSETLFWSERAWKAEMAGSNIRYRLFKTSWASRLERWHFQRLLRFVAAGSIVSASVQIVMLPLLIMYFHRISFASLWLNLFVGVAMAVLAFAALAATLVAQFSAVAAAPFVVLSERIEWLMVHAIDPIRGSSISAIRLPHYHGPAAMVYVFYFVALGTLALALARWNPLRPTTITGAHGKIVRASHLFSLWRLRLAFAGFSVLLGVMVLHPFSAAKPDGKLHIDYLDVGQGDAALVTMPDGTTMLIDGGGRPNIDWNRSDESGVEKSFERDTRSVGERVVSEYLWSQGLDRIDYLLPTHADADHIDGLNDIARNFKVRSAIVTRTPFDDPEYARFSQTMRSAAVPIERIGAGDMMRFGEVTVDVLWPPPDESVDAPWRNNDGTVLRVRYGSQAFLFAADIEKEAEARIVQLHGDLRSGIVKVAHHGSKTSSTTDFIKATIASLAIISVGRTSIFGHPNKEVVERWRGNGAQVMTTGAKGTISIVCDGQSLTVNTFVR
jgi:competence protein ComEC